MATKPSGPKPRTIREGRPYPETELAEHGRGFIIIMVAIAIILIILTLVASCRTSKHYQYSKKYDVGKE